MSYDLLKQQYDMRLKQDLSLEVSRSYSTEGNRQPTESAEL